MSTLPAKCPDWCEDHVGTFGQTEDDLPAWAVNALPIVGLEPNSAARMWIHRVTLDGDPDVECVCGFLITDDQGEPLLDEDGLPVGRGLAYVLLGSSTPWGAVQHAQAILDAAHWAVQHLTVPGDVETGLDQGDER